MHTPAQEPKGVITLSRTVLLFSKGKPGIKFVPPLDITGVELVLTDL